MTNVAAKQETILPERIYAYEYLPTETNDMPRFPNHIALFF